MNFQQCRYVEVVARVGSFSQAAKELYMTHPTCHVLSRIWKMGLVFNCLLAQTRERV